jgi:TonB-dependent receptor
MITTDASTLNNRGSVLGTALLKAGTSAAAVAALIVAGPVFAQATPPAPAKAKGTADDGTIIVTGIRGSLQNARTIKKASDTIVDSVSADDIGALPDRSVTETLQRIPGISINRFAAGVDPDHFSAEGSGVVVRGLTYVRSEFNGRDAFTANNGRAVGFADIPSELLGGVDVYKSLPADHIEGGIAGTVDLKTRKPFDQNKSFIAASIENNYSDFADKSAPNAAIIASWRTHTSFGDIGLLGSFSTSQLFSRSDRIAISHFARRCTSTVGGATVVQGAPAAGTPCPTGTNANLIPSGAVEGSQNFDRLRQGESATLQWRSNDRSLEATFQFLRSDAKEAWTEHTMEVTTDNVDAQGGVLAENGSQFGFSNGIFTNGIITGNTGYRADQWSGTGRTPVYGLQSNNISRGHAEENINDDYSANLKWKVSNRLTAVFDYQHATSNVSVDDNTLWASTYQDANIKLNGNALPTVSFLPPQSCSPNCPGGTASPSYFTGTHQSFSDPYNSFYRASMDHTERSDGYENAAKVDLKYDLPEDGFVKAVKVGYRFSDRQQTARFSTYNWGVLSEQWGGTNGPVWLDNPVAAQAPGYQLFSFPNFFGGAVPSPAGAGRLYFAGDSVGNYAQYAAYAQAIAAAWGGGGTWVPLAKRPGVIAGTPFLPGEVNPADERNNAAYIMANFGHEFDGGRKLSGNIGVRYTQTNRTSYGGAFVSTTTNNYATTAAQCSAPLMPGQTLPLFCTLPAATQAALIASNTGGAAAYTASVAKLKFDYWLPSVNLKLEMGHGLQFRAAYFKGIAPPDFGLTRNYFNISGINVTSSTSVNGGAPYLTGQTTAGNPYLKPTSSDNFDLTAEYYFGQGGQFTVSAFYKELHDVVTSNTFSSTVNVGSSVATITGYQPVNSSATGKVKGLEFSYQQNYTFLPGLLSGLGMQANYTFVDSTGVPQSTLSSTDPNVAAGNVSNIDLTNFPLQGLSKHTFNIVPYFEKGPLSVRLAYTWRSQYLLTGRDVITPFDPIFQRAYGQLDASASVTINKHLKIGIEGVNLTNSIVGTSAAVYDQNKNIILVPRAWYKTDRRYTISAHLNF